MTFSMRSVTFYARVNDSDATSEATSTDVPFAVLRQGLDHPGLSDALDYWERQARNTPHGIPLLNSLDGLLSGAVADFVNIVDCSADDPANYTIRRSRFAAELRGGEAYQFVRLDDIPSPLRELELLSLYYLRRNALPDLKLLHIPSRRGTMPDDFMRLLLPAVTTAGGARPDRALSVFSCLNGPRPTRIGITLPPVLLQGS